MTTSRRTILATGLFGAAGAAVLALRTGSAPRAKLETKPGKKMNVLFILSDQERAWDMYPAGFIDKHAPARTWLRNNGVSFSKFQTPAAFCSPARGIIYSGVQSPNNGMWDNAPIIYSSPLRRDIPTLGTLFQDAGYVTGYAGKWHLSRMKDKTTPEEAAEVTKTIQAYGFNETDVGQETDGALQGVDFDGRTAKQATDFFKRRQSGSGDKPWFLAVNLLNPHDIMYYTSGDEMTKSRASQFPDKSNRPPVDNPLYAQDLGYELWPGYGKEHFKTLPPAVKEYNLTFSEALGYMPYDDLKAGREMQNYYWNCTRDCDRHLQTILDGLKASGQLESTIIVFTSDHGELLGAHAMRGKGTGVFKEQQHVPAIVVHPAAPKGATSGILASHIDWAPTLMGLIGVNTDNLKAQLPMLVGRDFSAQVLDPKSSFSRDKEGVLLHWTAICYQDHTGVAKFDKARQQPGYKRPFAMREMMTQAVLKKGQMRAIYDGRWKFARYSPPVNIGQPTSFAQLQAGYDFEMYDTQSDPSENNNLAMDAVKWESQITSLNQRLNALIQTEIGVDDSRFIPFYLKI